MFEQAHPEEHRDGAGGGGSLIWFMVGAAVGVAAGMLYAPSSGRTTRERITGTGRELYGRSRELYERGCELVDDAAELFERGRRLATRDMEE